KGLVEGGWALLVGWILPALLDVLLFTLIVYPSVKDSPPFSTIPANEITLVIAAVVVGVVLSALKTPLYQILEGYILWPLALFRWYQRRQIKRRWQLVHILNYAHYSEAKREYDKAERLASAAENQGGQENMVTRENLKSATEKRRRWASAGVAAEEWLAN